MVQYSNAGSYSPAQITGRRSNYFFVRWGETGEYLELPHVNKPFKVDVFSGQYRDTNHRFSLSSTWRIVLTPLS
jgi:hypothetical protein